jgi:predicted TIM-barrel enzyme
MNNIIQLMSLLIGSGERETNTGSLLVLKDADGEIFGAWLRKRMNESLGSYCGSGDS